MEYQHGGDIYTNQVELDYSANINPLGLPEGVKQAYLKAVNQCSIYPDSRCSRLKSSLSQFHRVGENAVICGNGAAELIFLAVLAKKPQRALLLSPSFLEYEQALKAVGCEIAWFDLKEEHGFRLSVTAFLTWLLEREAEKELPDMVFLCNPNNPTGFAVPREELVPLIAYFEEHGILCVLDECFNEFLQEPERYSVIELVRQRSYKSLLILKAFTKIYAMAGLRLGYCITLDEAFLQSMERFRQPWSVSGPAQAAGEAALKETGYVKRTRTLVERERSWLKLQMEQLGFFVYDSMANYLFFRDTDPAAAGENRGRLYRDCLSKGVLIRSCSNYRGLDHRYYRVCVKGREENERFLSVLKCALKERK